MILYHDVIGTRVAFVEQPQVWSNIDCIHELWLIFENTAQHLQSVTLKFDL